MQNGGILIRGSGAAEAALHFLHPRAMRYFRGVSFPKIYFLRFSSLSPESRSGKSQGQVRRDQARPLSWMFGDEADGESTESILIRMRALLLDDHLVAPASPLVIGSNV